MTLFFFPFLLASFLYSCDNFEYHPLDGKIDIKNGPRNPIAISTIQKKHSKDSLKFVFIGDTHRDDGDTEDFVKHINKRKDIDFVIHVGDFTDFGLKKEYELSEKILSRLIYPYIVLIGNHDIRSRGDITYKSVYGEEDFSFVVSNVMFIFLNTNMLEYEKPVNIPNISFLKEQLEYINDLSSINKEKINKTIVIIHSPPKGEQFYDKKLSEEFHETIKKFPNLLCCLHGHTHRYSDVDLFEDGIRYYGCDNIAKRSYLVFTITKKGYTHEYVIF
ncbi:metallophosphoesterase [Parabacteroides sp. Marseille-P3160]|uniref:metallophosphoesterase family protein n=1 Tax=Parabacteroides sp. Marseille-P3160 TaxID=1917887 RepID=UPI000B4192FA|nr:metallophosphoesterase [Parabacteroides sp. Marseille-P3160]